MKNTLRNLSFFSSFLELFLLGVFTIYIYNMKRDGIQELYTIFADGTSCLLYSAKTKTKRNPAE